MPSAPSFNIGLDLYPLIAGTLACVACGLLGNFLVLRRLSLMGDAISHSVLPGIVAAFLIASTRSTPAMFLGAAIAGVITVVLVEAVKKLGRVEPGAAMGVVFSILFAVGVVLIESAAARHVDLDADCVLHGQLETLVWYDAPETLRGLLTWSTITSAPPQIATLSLTVALATGFILLLFKELRIAAFDPGLATTLGFNASLLHYALMIFVAAATVASFEAVGSVLVIAMLICPAASARLVTDRLNRQVAWSVVFAVSSSVGGYLGATFIPGLFGKDSVNAAGSIAVAAGAMFAAAMVASPRHGITARIIRRRSLGRRVAADDLAVALVRAEEAGDDHLPVESVADLLGPSRARTAIKRAMSKGLIELEQGQVRLSPPGRTEGVRLLRKHRLWETYLVGEAGLAPDHVHAPAEQLEHLPLDPPEGPDVDPHGKRIPH